jgi:hypothetical protein
MVVLWRRHDDRRALLVALAVMAVAFFVLPTRVHERYLYPFFALGAILLVLRPRWAAVYAVLAAANLANLYGILTLPFYDSPGLAPMLDAYGGLGTRLGETIRSSAGVAVAALAHAGGLVAAAAFLVRPVAGETDRVPEEDLLDDEVDEGPGPVEEARVTARSAVVGAAAAPPPAAAAPPPPAAAREPDERAPFDRSPALAREGGGRLDRLDLWFLLVLVAAVLVLRTFRLGEPMRMHFDEVYHARTAIEFLQDWRYGEPHAIYEYTHPHLAKYAIVEGVDLLGNNRVVAESDLGTPVRDAAIEPRWDVPPGTGAGAMTRGGERLYVATGDSLDVYDLRTRALLARFPVPGAGAVAVDPVARAVYVGTAGGEILTFATEVTADDLRAAPAEHAPQAFAGVGAAVERLWAVGDGDYLVAGTPDDGLVTVDAATAAELSRTTLVGRAEVVDAGRVAALVATPDEIPDRVAAAAEVTSLAGGDEAATATCWPATHPASSSRLTSRPTARRSTRRSRTAGWPGSSSRRCPGSPSPTHPASPSSSRPRGA